MNRNILNKLAFLAFAVTVTLCASQTFFAQLAVKGETVFTMAGEPIKNGVVLVKDGKIEAVGTAAQVAIPAGYRVISAKVVTPGLIDAHSVVGLNGYLNQPTDQMALDGSGPIQPELRAFDSYNSREILVQWLREFGVTTVNTGHQPSALVSGQTMVVKTFGNEVDDVMIVPEAMISVTLGGDGLAGQGKSPGTRAKQIAMLRAFGAHAVGSNLALEATALRQLGVRTAALAHLVRSGAERGRDATVNPTHLQRLLRGWVVRAHRLDG